MAYWIQCFLGISFSSYLVFLCHKKGKIALRDALIYIFIYGIIAHADKPPFNISDDMTYSLLMAVTFSIIFVNCILDRMNKGMLVVCFLFIAIMAKTYLVFSRH